MKGIGSKKAIIWITVALVTAVLLYNLPLLFFNESLLTKQVHRKLNNYFQKNGFDLKIAKVRWIGGGRFEASRIALTQSETGELLVKADRLIVGTDWTVVLKNPKNPEMVLREFEAIRPQLSLIHYNDQTWNFSQLFRKKGKRKIRMDMQIRIRNGRVVLDDYKLGKHRFQNVSGKLDFSGYPLVCWDFKGEADFGKALTWKSTGKMRTDQASGLGEARFVGLPLEKTILLMPWRNQFKVRTGTARGSIDFAWNKKTFWFQKGQAFLNNTVLKVPFLPDELRIVSAKTDFSPEAIQVFDSDLFYHKTKVKLTGTLDPLQQSVDARLNSRGGRLEDFLEMFPEIPQTVINGRTDLKLKITGKIKNPVFNGEARIYQTRVVSNQEVFEDVEGKLTVHHNDIRVHRAKALWHEAWVHARGTIKNIYNPRLNLQVHGNGVVLDEFELVRMAGPDLKLCHTADFTGKFTGFWDNPFFSGEARLEQLEFRNVPARNLQIGFTWEPMALKVKVLTLESDIWKGHLSAAGQVVADDKRVNWNITGKIKGLDLKEVNLLPADLGISGETVAAEAMLKGSWRYDAEFDPGTVMGVVKGQRLMYQNTVADEVAAVYSWSRGVLTVDSILIRIGEGRIFGNLTLDHTQLASKLTAENIPLDNLFERAAVPVKGLFKEGIINLEGDLADLKGRFSGEFSNLTWNCQPIGNVSGDLEYRHNNREIEIVNLLLNNPSGDYHISGKALFFEAEPQFDIKVASDNLQLKGLLTYFPLYSKMRWDGLGRLNVEIRGPLKTPSFVGTIVLTDPLIAGVKMDSSTVAFNGDLNRIQITQCEISNEDSQVFLAGSVERNKLDLNIGGTFSNLETFNLQYNGHRLKGRLTMEGRLEGSLEKPVLTAKVRGEKIKFGDFDYPMMTADFRWVAPELEIYNTRLIGGDNSISASGKIYTSQPVRFDLGLDVNNFKIRELLQLAKLEKVDADGNFSGEMVVSGTLNDPQIRLNGGISAAHINSVPVKGELSLYYTGNKLIVEKVGLLHDIGSFYATGVWEKDKALKLRGRLNQFPLATLNILLKNPQLKLAGAANADIVLEWSESLLQCNYQMTVDSLQINEEQLGNCTLNGNLNEYGLVIDSGNLVVKNGNLGLSGFIPWPDNLLQNLKLPGSASGLKNRLDLQMTLKNAPVALVNIFAVGYLVGGGECNGYLNIEGSLTKPEFSGKLDFSNTQLELPDMPLLVESILASVSIENNRAIVHRAIGYVDKGRIDVTGDVDFNAFPLMNLNLDFKGARVYFKNFFFDGYSDFEVKLAGEFNNAYLMGNLSLYNCKIGGLSLMGSKKGGKNDWNPQIDLMVKLGRKARFRQIGVADVSVDGAVHVKGSLSQPTLAGEVTTSQGVVTFYSQTFKVNRGEVVFSHTQGFNPFVDIEASLMTPKAQIFLKLKGQVGTEIMPMLSSQPALPQREIFALLNWADLSGEQPLVVGDVVGKNMNVVADALFSDIFYQIRDRVGFDYFYLETDYGRNEYRLNVGDYITDRLFVSYTWELISKNDKEDKWSFDYHLTSKMAAGGSYSVSEGRSWRLSYTFQF